MNDINFHNITEVKSEIKTITRDNGTQFHFRSIIITDEKNARFEISLFSSQRDNLKISKL